MERRFSLAGDSSETNSEFTVVTASEEQHWRAFLRVPRTVPSRSQTQADFERCEREEVRTTQNRDKPNRVMETYKNDRHVSLAPNRPPTGRLGALSGKEDGLGSKSHATWEWQVNSLFFSTAA